MRSGRGSFPNTTNAVGDRSYSAYKSMQRVHEKKTTSLIVWDFILRTSRSQTTKRCVIVAGWQELSAAQLGIVQLEKCS
jgi:hypothetical protein